MNVRFSNPTPFSEPMFSMLAYPHHTHTTGGKRVHLIRASISDFFIKKIGKDQEGNRNYNYKQLQKIINNLKI
jgi:hypothetical protein